MGRQDDLDSLKIEADARFFDRFYRSELNLLGDEKMMFIRIKKPAPRNPSEDDLKVLEEALEGVERLGREAEVKRILKNIIENQNKRLKGDTICRNQKTSENLQRRYQNFRGR